MTLKQINLSGFKNLYDGYKMAFDEKRKAFGGNLFTYLEHLMVGIELDDITGIELFYLKKFSSKIIVLGDKYTNFVNEANENLHNEVDNILKLHDEICNDDDINTSKSYVDNILPIGCKSYHVIAIFKGAAITSIVGPFPENIFIDEETKQLAEYYPEPIDLQNKIFELFFNNFYQFIHKHSTDLDLVTEFMTNKKYYDYADGIVNLAHVNTPFGSLEFFGNTPTELNKQITAIKSNLKSLPYFIAESTYFTFVLNTTFSAFLHLFTTTNFVVDNIDPKVVLNNPENKLSDDILSKYQARVSGITSKISELRTSITPDITYLNYILSGAGIKYSIQLTAADIAAFLNESDHSVFSTIDEFIEIKSIIKNLYNQILGILG